MINYEVQGRRTERGSDDTRKDIVRLDSASTSASAFAIAETMAADKLTAWVFETERRAGSPPLYRLLGVVTTKKRNH